MVVHHRAQQIIGGRNGMKIPSEMEVDVLHRQHLRVSPTGGAALHSKAGTKTRLSQADHGALVEEIQGIAQSDRRCGFSFPSRSGCDCSNKNELTVRTVCKLGNVVHRNLGYVMPVQMQVVKLDAEFLASDFSDWSHLRFLRNSDVRFWIRMLVVQARSNSLEE